MTDIKISEAQIAKCLEKCIHFNGTGNKVCKASVHYDSFDGTGIPCIVQFNKSNHQCSARVYPTREEAIAKIEASEKQYLEAVQRMEAVAPTVNECRIIAGHKGGKYERACAACNTGRLHIRIAPNRHARVSCTTEGCVNWIE